MHVNTLQSLDDIWNLPLLAPDEDAPGWLRCSALARCSCCFWAALTCWGEEPKGNRLSSAVR
eukprot:1142607-Pelagomonas_calceolata.AAC.1